MGLKEQAKYAKELKQEYIRLYSINKVDEGKKLELEYLSVRRKIIESVDDDIMRQKSIPMYIIKERVAKKEKPKRIETGIRSLDFELVTEDMKTKGIKGGLALGNFIQIAGSRGSGKSSIMLKMLTGFSLYETVCWFDFEMGEDRVVQKLEDFYHDDKNMMYYNSSRMLSDIVDEIKFLNASGVNHFVIDSAMKVLVKGVDRYEKFSTVSGELSALTSTLGINIYMINQLSQSSEREGHLMIKHGNDAEYDADFIFYILRKPKMDDEDKNVYDDLGMMVFDEDTRILKCTKNRQDERLFSVEIPKSQIMGIKKDEVEYADDKMESEKHEMPRF